ncbi:MAG: nuclear transport factor 2 family protein [Bacteroidota bacterium]
MQNPATATTPKTGFADIVTRYLSCYETGDKNTLEELLSEDLVFSSPDDPELEKDEYFEKCWAMTDLSPAFKIGRIVSDGNEGYVSYDCITADGKRFHNTEYIRLEGDLIQEIEVYYGNKW